MIFPEAMMHETIWFNRESYQEERANYQLFLANNLSLQLASTHSEVSGSSTNQPQSSLSNEIAKARNSIKQTLKGGSAGSTVPSSSLVQLENENKGMAKTIAELVAKIADLEARIVKLESNASSASATNTPKQPAKDADDDDFDMFGDSSEEEEETEEEKKRKEEALRKYQEKKGKKPGVIAKSTILLDIKPWDDETDMKEIERLVREIELDGLVWGSSKLMPLAYGIKKLQIVCVVEDDKVGTDILEELITKNEDYVQSVDIAAFNKV